MKVTGNVTLPVTPIVVIVLSVTELGGGVNVNGKVALPELIRIVVGVIALEINKLLVSDVTKLEVVEMPEVDEVLVSNVATFEVVDVSKVGGVLVSKVATFEVVDVVESGVKVSEGKVGTVKELLHQC